MCCGLLALGLRRLPIISAQYFRFLTLRFAVLSPPFSWLPLPPPGSPTHRLPPHPVSRQFVEEWLPHFKAESPSLAIESVVARGRDPVLQASHPPWPPLNLAGTLPSSTGRPPLPCTSLHALSVALLPCIFPTICAPGWLLPYLLTYLLLTARTSRRPPTSRAAAARWTSAMLPRKKSCGRRPSCAAPRGASPRCRSSSGW